MTIRVAINGFGRIGRLVLRAYLERTSSPFEIVAINDLAPAERSAHLLRFDSVHGRLPHAVDVTSNGLSVNGKQIAIVQERDPAKLPWRDMNIDLVLECTGHFTKRADAEKHIVAGAKRVLLSAPGADEDFTVVYGINHEQLKSEHKIVSNGSCTTNCLTPVAAILHRNFGIVHGTMLTVHSYTGDQRTVDTDHEDLYRARAAGINMIPTSTGAAKAVVKVLPELKDKLDGLAIRVPTANVSLVHFAFEAAKPTTVEAVNQAFQDAAAGMLKGVLAVTKHPNVSTDFNHDAHSATVALPETKVTDGTLVRVLAWYDNEWGFANRMNDVAALMASL